ncbi:MAG TPA: threonine--tRNA ligase [Alphaproteobacteria bacterium]
MSANAALQLITVTLPDGALKQTTTGSTGYDVAKSIGEGLAKAALAVKIDGQLKDLSTPLHDGAKLEIVTRKSEEALELIRHDTAHVLAEAVQALFPGTQVTIGPSIEDGFYYDFARAEPFITDDLGKIEAKMREIIAKGQPFVRQEIARDKAIALFKAKGEEFKVELIQDLGEDQVISLYSQGEWLDLCRGPHMRTTNDVGNAFKLTKVAGAYWRGDSNRPMLQRIYGTAWRDQKELDAYLTRIEEAEKRDHRKLGKQLELFHMQEEAAGMVFWHPKGFSIFKTLENYIRAKIQKADYVEVKTPEVFDRIYWEQSGHWENYKDKMFVVQDAGDEENIKTMGLKPMNCPGHVQIFKQGIKSYRDLPLRMAEFGCCHRNESSGSMHGLMRVRQMTQDDAHIFCTEDQIVPETASFCKLVLEVYKDLGFNDVRIVIATRPDKRAGTDEIWDKAENGLKDAVTKAGLDYQIDPGEGAFYGPKLEFHLTDAIGRSWQCGTLQLDFVLPERLDAHYTAEDGSRQRPVMLHRATLGSMERFIGILIESYAGAFPTWIAPVQAVVMTITNEFDEQGKIFAQQLKDAGIRVVNDARAEKINYKIREHSMQKVPYILVLGAKEIADGNVSVRRFGSEETTVMSQMDLMETLCRDAAMPT